MALENSRARRVASGIEAFGEHLLSHLYRGWRFSVAADFDANLFESVKHWLENGDAVDVCKTYEDFTFAALEIIIGYLQDADGTVESIAVWPNDSDDPGVGRLVPLASREFRDGVIEIRDVPWFRFYAVHPLFDPELFAHVAQQRRHTL